MCLLSVHLDGFWCVYLDLARAFVARRVAVMTCGLGGVFASTGVVAVLRGEVGGRGGGVCVCVDIRRKCGFAGG